MIKMDSGGSADEDSNRAGKGWSRRESLGVSSRSKEKGPVISFGPMDQDGLNLPYNDTLVIRARVANYEVQRVFVDSENSVNVIFHETFGQMDFKGYKLKPVETALFGFAGHTVYPREGDHPSLDFDLWRNREDRCDFCHCGEDRVFIQHYLGEACDNLNSWGRTRPMYYVARPSFMVTRLSCSKLLCYFSIDFARPR